ncbi:MAG TPA: hypothetical protein VGR15_02235, partial [Bacteroidota bacterium]|nr:hypothetical protein [Bacteroidota bacterium]
CVIIDDMIGDTNKVDVVANKSMGAMVLTYLSDKLIGKGYHVDNTVLTSVGLAMDQERVYKIVRSVGSKDTDVEDLPIGIPPFFLNDLFRDETSGVQLRAAYDSLLRISPDEGSEKPVIPFTGMIGKHSEAGTLMIMFLGGFSVAVSKQYNNQPSSDHLTVGAIQMQPISQLTMTFYVVDAGTGELLWTDRHIVRGGTIHKEKILQLADRIIEDLP